MAWHVYPADLEVYVPQATGYIQHRPSRLKPVLLLTCSNSTGQSLLSQPDLLWGGNGHQSKCIHSKPMNFSVALLLKALDKQVHKLRRISTLQLKMYSMQE